MATTMTVTPGDPNLSTTRWWLPDWCWSLSKVTVKVTTSGGLDHGVTREVTTSTLQATIFHPALFFLYYCFSFVLLFLLLLYF
jgi:hypothetical protein